MKIGIFVDELFTGGFQRVAYEEAIAFKQKGYNVEMVILRRTQDKSATEYIADMTSKKIKINYASDSIPKIFNFSFKFPFFAFFSFFHLTYIFLLKIYFHEEYDFIIVHGTYTSLSCIPYAKKNSIKIANFIHDPIEYIFNQKYRSNIVIILIFNLLGGFAHFFDSFILKNSDLVIVYPKIEQYLKSKHVLKINYLSIFNGVKKSTQFYVKKKFAIAATKWDQGKNYNLFIELWSKYKLKIDLIVAGRWANQNEKNKFQYNIKKHRLEGKIKVIGQISSEKLNKLYSQALFLIHPCREAFGMTILEAAANKTSSIFTNNSGVANIMDDKSCIMVKENCQVDYVRALNRLINDNNLVISLGIEAYKISKKYSWEKHNDLILNNIK